jgi:hypothetical protein
MKNEIKENAGVVGGRWCLCLMEWRQGRKNLADNQRRLAKLLKGDRSQTVLFLKSIFPSFFLEETFPPFFRSTVYLPLIVPAVDVHPSVEQRLDNLQTTLLGQSFHQQRRQKKEGRVRHLESTTDRHKKAECGA